ncbi:nucleotidyltransferase substrate binding protein [bacterium]|nr:nucleotidyltransferase substrate binding protein [bacterium]
MKNEIKFAFEKLGKALTKLDEGARSAREELERDGVIQRFEFSFELFWKTLKIILADQGIQAATPKAILQEAFRLGWITEDQVFLNMLEDRNRTSHIYDSRTALAIFNRIQEQYVSHLKEVFQKVAEQYHD